MDVRPLEGPLSRHHNLLSLVLSIRKCPVKVSVVLELEVVGVEFGHQHSSTGDCDLGEWVYGECEYGCMDV